MQKEPRLLRLQDVMEITSLSKSTIYRKEKSGKFPKRLNCGGNMIRWNSFDISKWIESLLPVGA